MSAPGVPPWGCPWHGKVQGGQLSLINGGTQAYPQPAGVMIPGPSPVPDRFGETHRVAVPGVLPVERSEGELAQDAAAGREWRNEAVLAGALQCLHGKNLNGWIYIDPDGNRWRARCAQLADENTERTIGPLNLTITLSRFGELGGAAQQFSYSLTLTDWGTAGTTYTKARLLIDAIRSDGAAVIVMVHERRAAELQIRWPHSFLQLTIAGPGSDATVAIAVVRSRAQVLTVERSDTEGAFHLAGWHAEGDNGGEWLTLPAVYAAAEDGGTVHLTEHEVLEGEVLKRWQMKICYVVNGDFTLSSRRVMALWYGPDNSIVEVAVAASLTANWSDPMPSDGARASSVASNWTIAIEVDGAAFSSVSGSEERTHSETFNNPFMPGAIPGSDSRHYSSTLVADGDSLVTSGSPAPNSGTWSGVGWGDSDRFQYTRNGGPAGPEVSGPTPAQLCDLTYEYGYAQVPLLSFIRYANHLIGLQVYRPGAGVYAYHPPATPSGSAGGSVYLGGSTTNRYGSWCPYTHHAQWRSSVPVCYV